MTTIKDIFQTYAPEYIRRFGEAMPFEHRKVIDAILNCRSEYYGTNIYKCDKCGQCHIVYRCCGNRHCPNCQYHKSRQWLQTQLKRQLPGHHYMITFTVPKQIRRFIRSNQRICYSAMFAASSQTIKKLTCDEKYIGGDLPGFFGVLHTWGRQLSYHPHIHYVVAGGAFSKKDGNWHPSRIDFFLPIWAMSNVFKAKFLDELRKSKLASEIPVDAWKQDWIVNCQAVGSSEASVKYLAPYVFRVAISNSRIIKIEHRKVFFKYKKPRSRRLRIIALGVMEFIRRFLQHVLPTGFTKVRYYGFMSPASSIPLQKIATLIELAFGFEIETPKVICEPIQMPKCSHCGGNLKHIATILPLGLVLSRAG